LQNLVLNLKIKFQTLKPVFVYNFQQKYPRKGDRPSLFLKNSVAFHLDEIPLAQICCHAKVVFFTQTADKTQRSSAAQSC
jgi:hypothetical protein